jgi:hypothetical protein
MEENAVTPITASKKIFRRASLTAFILALFTILSGPIIFAGKLNTNVIIIVSLITISSALSSIDVILRLLRKEKLKLKSIIFGAIAGVATILFLLMTIYFLVNYPFVPGAA